MRRLFWDASNAVLFHYRASEKGKEEEEEASEACPPFNTGGVAKGPGTEGDDDAVFVFVAVNETCCDIYEGRSQPFS